MAEELTRRGERLPERRRKQPLFRNPQKSLDNFDFNFTKKILLGEIADATLDGSRKEHMELLTTVPLLVYRLLGMRNLPSTAAEELLEIVMRRCERTKDGPDGPARSSSRTEDWGKILGDNPAVTAMLDRLLHRGHIVKYGRKNRLAGSGERRINELEETQNQLVYGRPSCKSSFLGCPDANFFAIGKWETGAKKNKP